MAVLIAIETVVLALLAFLVVGLLRSHADVLRQLHALGAPLEPDASDAPISLRPRGDAPRAGLGPAYDVAGAGLRDDAVLVPIVGVPHRTLLAFLSSGCLTCRTFWDAFRDPDALRLPDDVRIVVVTNDVDAESPSTLRELAAADLPVVMSSEAWDTYAVPGSPYFVLVDGASDEPATGAHVALNACAAIAAAVAAFAARPGAVVADQPLAGVPFVALVLLAAALAPVVAHGRPARRLAAESRVPTLSERMS